MTKNKSRIFNKLVGGFLAFIFAISLLPLSALAGAISFAATPVSLPNPNFDKAGNIDSEPSAWTSTVHEGLDANSTVMGGRIKTDPLSWTNTYKGWIDTWVNRWSTENAEMRLFELHTDDPSIYVKEGDLEYTNKITYAGKEYIFNEDNKTYVYEDDYFVVHEIDSISSNLKQELYKKIPATPLKNGYDHTAEDNGEMYVLMMFAGDKIDVASAEPFNFSDNEVFYTFTQTTNASTISVNDFGFYRASVWVNTYGDANASFDIEGIKLDNSFNAIKTSNPDKTKDYYIYLYYSSDTDISPVPIVSDVEPKIGAIIDYDKNNYEFSIFDPANPNSSSAKSSGDEDGFIKYDSTVESDFDWVEYSIYFSTSEASSITFLLGLGNEETKSTGMVFFDDLTLTKLTQQEYMDATAPENLDEQNILGNTERELNIINDFATEDDFFVFSSDKNGTDLSTTDDKTMFIDHYNTGNVSLKSDPFSLDALKYYRVSIWVLPKDASLKFTLTLSADMQGTPSKTQEISITSTTVNTWNEYAFLVAGNAFNDTEVTLGINITSTGRLEIDNLATELIGLSTYNGSTSTNKIDLKTTNQTETVKNGHFNSYVNVDKNSTVLPPADWFYIADAYKYYKDSTKTALSEFDQTLMTEYEAKAKMVYDEKEFVWDEGNNGYYYQNTETNLKERITKIENSEFIYSFAQGGYYNNDTKNKLDLANDRITITSTFPSSEAQLPKNDVLKNVLKISPGEDVFSLRSSAITITKNKYYYLNFYVFGKGIARVVDSKGNIYAEFEFDSEAWEHYGAYIRSASADKILYLTIGVNEDNSTDTYFANIKNTDSSDATTAEKQKLPITEMITNRSRVIDLAKNSLSEHSFILNEHELYDSFMFKSSSESTGIFGILDTVSDSKYKTAFEDKITSISDSYSRTLLIQNTAGQKTIITPVLQKTLAKDSYYAISVLIKTIDIASGTKLSLKIVGNAADQTIDETFDYINTTGTGDKELNDYTVYTLYVATGDNEFSDFSIEISLDGAGTVLVGEYQVDTTDKAGFDAETDTESDSIKVLNYAKGSSSDDKTTDDTTPEETEEKKTDTVMLFFIVLSSILLVAAVVLVLIVVGMRKLPKRKKVKYTKKPRSTDGERGFV